MASNNPVWVFVDARYSRAGDKHRAEVPALGLAATAESRDEAHEEITKVVARHLRPLLVKGQLPGYLEKLGFYEAEGGEWIPRITGEDERIYVHVTPIESLPMV